MKRSVGTRKREGCLASYKPSKKTEKAQKKVGPERPKGAQRGLRGPPRGPILFVPFPGGTTHLGKAIVKKKIPDSRHKKNFFSLCE
jgi:hypothetical protein